MGWRRHPLAGRLALGQDDCLMMPPCRSFAQASLATGHISPPWFIQRLRGTGWLPRRVALLGQLEPLPDAEVSGACCVRV